MPHYPEAYLESKHCKIFAHWRTPKGVSLPVYLQALVHALSMLLCELQHGSAASARS